MIYLLMVYDGGGEEEREEEPEEDKEEEEEEETTTMMTTKMTATITRKTVRHARKAEGIRMNNVRIDSSTSNDAGEEDKEELK